MKILLDLKKSAAENASLYYQKAKKFKKKIEGAKNALQQTKEKIKKLKEEKTLEERKERKLRKKEKKSWYEKFRYSFSSDNFLVIGGKDSASNEILIKKYLEKNDLVFHAQIQGAPFFIIKNPQGKKIPEKTLKEAAQMAASYSKAWQLGLGSLDVYYVKPEQLSKEAPAGEYLGKGAFMIYGKKNWLRNIELKISIGVQIKEEAKIISGPESAVSSKTNYFLVIIPGDKKSKELAQEIKEKILKKVKKEDKEKIKNLPLEEIQKFIPAGKGSLK